jgi:hypothetical protein
VGPRRPPAWQFYGLPAFRNRSSDAEGTGLYRSLGRDLEVEVGGGPSRLAAA